ncbi:reverse transcriptase-RNase H-integrase [Laccaria bicolor S238N-H82]|uniref:RNA-directed DNA polymerase n=1 Tax=Laccaria bicolor (strain S238N-H82 / ATCC MYA-4686) TaxID=486041 RepID=B0DTI1_LACBS|nr:reverse transcriptase-RNase H-integrase [Laccaria bicolor S238N-H82]EDR02067.1 reverse transcriptase-RNase H-integrase [Laccaria bicolor S238N-H82]|eukprot:XP_001887224.1 reverse transcriptase-RNase H-integrase [Laccaria bicolor S238N-H82]
MSTLASVEPTSGKAPVLTAGDLTPAVAMDFENAAQDFFVTKSVPLDKQVALILPGIKDIRIRDWITADRARITTLSFVEFIKELRANYLQSDWEDQIRNQILTSTLTSSHKSFWNWSQHLLSLNCLLRNTPSALDDIALHNHLEAHLDDELKEKVKHSEARNDKVFKTWVAAVRVLDEARTTENKRQIDLIEGALQRQAKRQATDANALRGPSRRNNSAASTSTSTTSNRLAPLTEGERTLLNEHDGCTKCRRFYVGHRSHNCDLGFPTAKGYKTLTVADALTAKKAKATSKSTTKAVSATISTVDSSDDEVTAAAAVLPNSPKVYASDSEEDADVSRCNVSAPLRVKHLFWNCQIHGLIDDFPVKTRALIDNGAHLVLIRPELAAELGLKKYRLREPEIVDVALKNSESNHRCELSKYVKLSFTSLDARWTSRKVKAIIAPGLCAPVILGLPFLQHNSIVVDHADRSCIDKKSGYDLLNPPPCLPPPPPKPRLREQIKNTKADKKLVLAELMLMCHDRQKSGKGIPEEVAPFNVAGAIRERVETLAAEEALQKREKGIKSEFKEIFEPIPHIDELPTGIVAEIHLKNAEKTIKTRTYPSPRKYKEAWQILIQQHLDAGRIRPSSSPFASPAFIVPKANPNVLPRWVNDYRQLNENTVTDSHPLPRIDDILNDCAKGKIWATIDMTNSFFQTRMHPDHIPLTAVTTPLGLYEWLVMPMGLKNAPAIHQRRVTLALRQYIGKICHIYLDDIVIWSNTIEEHVSNVQTILQALHDARLYVNPDKTHLFCREIDFLGHHISARGIEADSKKADRILAWPQPKSVTDVRAFLGLVRYLAAFLPALAEHTGILTELTIKECEKAFPTWTDRYQTAFDSIKAIVTSRECLTTIDLSKLPEYKIFVTTDASDKRSGAILSFGTTWENARPVAFDSMTFKGAELNYPVHEKELLAIIRALKRWRVDLLGSPFFIYTDHKTLENFVTQRDLSRRQARWMEFMSQFDAKIIYIKGEDNTVADALSRLPYSTSSQEAETSAQHPYNFCPDDESENMIASIFHCTTQGPRDAAKSLAHASDDMSSVNATLKISSDETFLQDIKAGYAEDSWCKTLPSAALSLPTLQLRDDLWYIGNRLIIPRTGSLRETLFMLAHDTLGHFGFHKTYGSLRDAYYWPNMRRDLEEGYIKSCPECQRNKSSTTKPLGPLHPLPIPDQRGDSVAIDFIGPLPEDEGKNCIITFTDRLGSDIRIIATRTDITAEDLATLFFDEWYCENGLPADIVSDRDKLFVSRFWKALHRLTGVKLKMSTAYHPETDGASERTNKTVNQALRFHVERNQLGWARALPRIRFDMMNTVNKSTGFSPFQLRMGRSPRIIPPLVPAKSNATVTDIDTWHVIRKLETDVLEAQDNLLKAKISQSTQSNKHRTLKFPFEIGSRVRLSTLHRRNNYKAKGEKRVAKFMPRYDGPYTIIDVDEDHSTVTLDLPNSPNIFPVFHTSEILPYIESDTSLFPSRHLEEPRPIITEDGQEEYSIDKILDARRRGRGYQYLVRWSGYGAEHDKWLPGSELQDCEALDRWLESRVGSP